MIENFPKENSRWFVKPKSAHFNPVCESGCCQSHVLVFRGFPVCTPFHAMENAIGPTVILHSPPSWGVRFLSLLCSWQLLPFESSPLIFSPQRLSLSPLVGCLLQLPPSCQVSAASLFRTKWASMGVADSESTLFKSSKNIFLSQSCHIVKNYTSHHFKSHAMLLFRYEST